MNEVLYYSAIGGLKDKDGYPNRLNLDHDMPLGAGSSDSVPIGVTYMYPHFTATELGFRNWN